MLYPTSSIVRIHNECLGNAPKRHLMEYTESESWGAKGHHIDIEIER